MNVQLTIRKLNGIALKMATTDVEGRIALKNAFCKELTSFLEEVEATGSSIASKTIVEKYLEPVKEGNYIKAIDCLEDLEGMNKNHFF